MMHALLNFSGQQAEVGPEMRATEHPRQVDISALLPVSWHREERGLSDWASSPKMLTTQQK